MICSILNLACHGLKQHYNNQNYKREWALSHEDVILILEPRLHTGNLRFSWVNLDFNKQVSFTNAHADVLRYILNIRNFDCHWNSFGLFFMQLATSLQEKLTAYIAMVKILLASCSTNATSITMVLTLRGLQKKKISCVIHCKSRIRFVKFSLGEVVDL
jgi:hypothetical protein